MEFQIIIQIVDVLALPTVMLWMLWKLQDLDQTLLRILGQVDPKLREYEAWLDDPTNLQEAKE